MILPRGVSQVEKEPEGRWNESLAWIVPLGRGRIGWAIKTKDWNCKSLRCRGPFSARGEQSGGRVWPPPHRAVPPWQEAVPSGAGAEDIPVLLLFPAGPLSRHGCPSAPSSGQKGWWHSPLVHRILTRIDSLQLVQQLQKLLKRLQRW